MDKLALSVWLACKAAKGYENSSSQKSVFLQTSEASVSWRIKHELWPLYFCIPLLHFGVWGSWAFGQWESLRTSNESDWTSIPVYTYRINKSGSGCLYAHCTPLNVLVIWHAANSVPLNVESTNVEPTKFSSTSSGWLLVHLYLSWELTLMSGSCHNYVSLFWNSSITVRHSEVR